MPLKAMRLIRKSQASVEVFRGSSQMQSTT